MEGNARMIAGNTTKSPKSAAKIAAAASSPKYTAGTDGVKHSIREPHASKMDVDVNARAVFS